MSDAMARSKTIMPGAITPSTAGRIPSRSAIPTTELPAAPSATRT